MEETCDGQTAEEDCFWTIHLVRWISDLIAVSVEPATKESVSIRQYFVLSLK